MTPTLRSLGCVSALLLAGCAPWAPAPSPLAPFVMPERWTSASADGPAGPLVLANAGWWAHFKDPLLPLLQEQALQANPSLLQARAALRQSRALVLGGEATLRPQLDGRASAQRQQEGSQSQGSLFALGLDAAWELDLFGAQRQAVAALQAGAEASAAQLDAVRLSLLAEVALRYIALRGLQARLQVADANLRSQQQTLQITDWRAQAGLLSQLELAQARSALAQTSASLPALRGAIRQAQHALAVLTGQAPGRLRDQLDPAGPLPMPDATLALSLPADTLRQRPDVREAEWRLHAAEARVGEAEAARWPRFSLSGSLGLQALRLGGLGGAPLLSSLLASVRGPLLDGGAARAQVTAQQAALEQARSAYRGSLLAALQEVEDALAALRADTDRSLDLAQATDAARAAADLARLRFRSGLVDFPTVLSTERAQLATQDAWAIARAELSADHVRLFKALGGGWTSDGPSNAATATNKALAPSPPPPP